MAYYSGYKNNSFPKQPSAAEKYKNWAYGRLKVTVTPGKPSLVDKEPSNIINIYNIDEQDAKDIVAKVSALPNKKTASIWTDKKEPTHLLIKIYSKNSTDWLDGGDLNAIQSVLYKSGKYDNNEVAHLEDQIATSIEQYNSEDKDAIAKEMHESVLEMWQRYLSEVNDPKTQAQLMLYKRLYKKKGVYGIILSIRNADLIRTRMPDATFVTTKNTWETQFGRGVKRNAKKLPYIIWKAHSGNSSSEFEAAKATTDWDTEATSNLSAQVLRGIDKIAGANKNGSFMTVIGYDVSDTYRLDGAPTDKFNDEIGLLNNLTGELNKHALDREASLGQTAPDANVDGQDEMEKRTKMAVEYMSTNAKELNITPKSSGNDNDDLADMVYEYCLNGAAKKAGILSPSNAQIYAENCTKVTLILTKLALPALKKYNQTYTYNKKEVDALMSIVYGLVNKLENCTSLNEGLLSKFKDKYKFAKAFASALKSIGCEITKNAKEDAKDETDSAEIIKEGFYKIFNRINSDIF